MSVKKTLFEATVRKRIALVQVSVRGALWHNLTVSTKLKWLSLYSKMFQVPVFQHISSRCSCFLPLSRVTQFMSTFTLWDMGMWYVITALHRKQQKGFITYLLCTYYPLKDNNSDHFRIYAYSHWSRHLKEIESGQLGLLIDKEDVSPLIPEGFISSRPDLFSLRKSFSVDTFSC